MIIQKSKKALMSRTTVLIVILVISFVLIFVATLKLFAETGPEEDACYTSVTLRGSSHLGPLNFAGDIPFQCKREKLCFGEGCSSLGQNYDELKGKTKQEILEEIADRIYEWHTTLGEGKINFMPRNFWSGSTYCFISTVMSFDDATRKNIDSDGGITQGEILQALASKADDDGGSYLKHLYDRNYPEELMTCANVNDPGCDALQKYYSAPINLTNDQAIIAQMSTVAKIEDWVKPVLGAVNVVTSVALVAASGGAPIIAIFVIKALGATSAVLGGIGYWSDSVTNNGVVVKYSPPRVIPNTAENLNALKCTFATLS